MCVNTPFHGASRPIFCTESGTRGEHWFHTDAQLRFLDDWILNRKEKGEGTERKETELLRAWKAEEDAAHIHGWDFSHIADRYTEETDLPWDYQRIVLERLRPEMKLLDIDTGGGEFLLSLHHPYANTSAPEKFGISWILQKFP